MAEVEHAKARITPNRWILSSRNRNFLLFNDQILPSIEQVLAGSNTSCALLCWKVPEPGWLISRVAEQRAHQTSEGSRHSGGQSQKRARSEDGEKNQDQGESGGGKTKRNREHVDCERENQVESGAILDKEARDDAVSLGDRSGDSSADESEISVDWTDSDDGYEEETKEKRQSMGPS
ncbi:hypothetical protein P154DRAFT_586964 [Amniculicola lignicola CBS 123094]|uniref:Uncharacterized protein n=1 Tax=Amniculicola lignicola CBS 123094 TaxID=1392246 RepID=A0A6A5VYR9_9PLEO|nr:hypothetical protein P154DRAFT_586964 [Amniculicola lignicola CBS 123094]